jgi:hypothetical protein
MNIERNRYYQNELLNYANEVNLFAHKFIQSDSELFLKTEDQAEFEGKIHEIDDLFDDIWGSGNNYSISLANIVNNGYGGYIWGPSWACVKKIVHLVQAAHRKLSREANNPSLNVQTEMSKTYINLDRIKELEAIKNNNFDLRRLIELCRELNIAASSDSFLAMVMIMRTIINHVPPIFSYRNFSEVANNYNWGKSFKTLILRLEESLRDIADSHLHKQIDSSEVLPNYTQVSFAPEFDVLLGEIVKILK